jgi:hypothetical protein
VGDGRIVDEDVEAAKAARRVGDHPSRVRRAADVRPERDRPAAEGAHRAGRVLGRQQIGARDIGPLSRQRQGDSAPDAAR